MARELIADDWLAQRLEALHPGWRGRLVIRAPEEADEHHREELVGTVTGEAHLDRDPESGGVIDAHVTFCTNWRDGAFVPLAGEARITVCMSQVEDIQPL